MASNGIDWQNDQNQIVNTKIKTIYGVFDSMAKPLFLNMLKPRGHKSCPKCYIETVYESKRAIFYYSQNLVHRTSEEFEVCTTMIEQNNLSDYNGIKGQAPISTIDFYDPIESSVIDLMHAVDLGVTRRFFLLWTDSVNKNKPYYIDRKNRESLDKLFGSIKPPTNLPRALRSLSELASFKANEFNSLLLFIFPVFFRHFMNKIYYDHFYLLSFSISTLTSKSITDADLKLCDYFLNRFVKDIQILYGNNELTFNMHLLLHLVQSVRESGSLTDLNSYIFENTNGELRNLISGTNNVGKQIAKKSELLFTAQINLLINPQTTHNNVLRHRSTLDDKYKTFLTSFFPILPTHQFATFTDGKKYFTSKYYKREKKQFNGLVSTINGFLFIECFIQKDEDVFGSFVFQKDVREAMFQF